MIELKLHQVGHYKKMSELKCNWHFYSFKIVSSLHFIELGTHQKHQYDSTMDRHLSQDQIFCDQKLSERRGHVYNRKKKEKNTHICRHFVSEMNLDFPLSLSFPKKREEK